MHPSAMQFGGVLLVLATGCGDERPFEPGRFLRLQWQDDLAVVGAAAYVFSPETREVRIDESDTDTTVAVVSSYTLASGGFDPGPR